MGGDDSAAITRLLHDWHARPHDRLAAERIARGVYGDLRAIAARRLHSERHQPLSPTELVHEAWLRLSDTPQAFTDRGHFYRLASVTMRHLLVDLARERCAAKRGAGVQPVSLRVAEACGDAFEPEILDLDRALTQLARDYPRHAQVVDLRCFGGLTVPEVGDVLDISAATVKRDWEFARAWLVTAMQEGNGDE